MKWFEHDTNASNDKKIKHLIMRHGAVGYAVYFHCLELIAGDVCENNITFELEHDSIIIADDLKINGDGKLSGCDTVQQIMMTCIELNLFQTAGGRVFCFTMAKRVNKSQIKNPRLRAVQDQIRSGKLQSLMDESEKLHFSLKITENQGKVLVPDQTRPDQTIKENAMSINFSPDLEITEDDFMPEPTKRFKKPTLSEVITYCQERQNKVNPQKWFAHYESNGYRIGKTKMVDWKKSIQYWELSEFDIKDKPSTKQTSKRICRACGSDIPGTMGSCPDCGQDAFAPMEETDATGTY
jgi:hypothetical protein